MEVEVFSGDVSTRSVEALVIGIGTDKVLSAAASEIDRRSEGLVARLLGSDEFSGKLSETLPLWGIPGLATPLVLLVGLGDKAKLGRGTAFRACGAAAKWLAAKRRSSIAFAMADDWSDDLVESAIAGALVGCQGQDLYRAEKKRHTFDKISFHRGSEQAAGQGKILGEGINLTRRLVNEPPQEIYPASFAEKAGEVAGESGLEIEVWDEDRLQRERAGSLLAVAKGSSRPPRLVILRHRGTNPDAPWLGLVGKGVTFDSGGLSLKPSDSMKTMKCDMAGAATVLGAMRTIAKLKLPVNVIGLMGLVENMPGGNAMKLGDVLHARNGRTIEVQNTDAEGRLVLADVLDVAVEQGAAKLIDLATLTGACVVALGTDTTGLMGNEQGWCDTLLGAAGKCGEPIWQLPMFPEYRDSILSEVADIRNTGEGRWGGAIAAAKFLEEFVGGKPWAHLDIAGPAFIEKAKSWQDGGGSGCMVRTLVEIARGWNG